MRIAVNARFLTQRVTGVQRYAIEVTKHLIGLLGESNVILLAPKGAPDQFYGVHVVRSAVPLGGYAWEQFALPHMFRTSGAEILWSPGNVGSLSVREQVLTIHDVAVFVHPQGFNRYFASCYRFALPRLANRAGAIITVSNFSRKEVSQHLGIKEEKINVIYPGVDSRFSPYKRDDLSSLMSRLELPEQYVLSVASLAPNKNFTGLINAWKILRKNLKGNVQLVLVGGMPRTLAGVRVNPAELREMDVYLLGYLEDSYLPAVYSGAEAFVFVSLYEGFGLPPLEAMACGTPVVVSKVASLPEVVGDAGIYVNPYDVEDIARGIYAVLSDPELRSDLRRRGLERAKMFSWEKTAKETLAVFEEVLSEGRG